MTAGFFSPLPPERTGVAAYSAALLEALRQKGAVTLNDPNAGVCLYHLGNNSLHREIYRRALSHPGVAVLHDAVLHHFFLGFLNEVEYIEEFTYNYGRWNEGLARRLWRNRARSGADPLYFRYPMLKRVVERSRAVIVHNPAAARMVREHVPGARVYEIPHLSIAGPDPPAFEVIRLRASFGLAPGTFLFGVFGHLRESKRIGSILRAVETLRGAGEPLALLLAGEFASTDLQRRLTGQLTAPGVLRVGYTPEIAFRVYSQAVDACINLRYPAAGETSGIAIRLMGIGKPVVLTAGEETARIPPSAAVKVDPGTPEVDMLTELMLWLARFRGDAEAVGERARLHIARQHAPTLVADLYWQALAESRA